jgi:cardiolipin synthase
MIALSVISSVTIGAILRWPLPWWLGVPLLVYWVVVAVLLIMDDREPSRTLTWLFVLLLLPGLGLVFFLFFGRDWKVITARRHWAEGYMAALKAKMRPIYERNAAAVERFEREYRDTAPGVAMTIEKENGASSLRPPSRSSGGARVPRSRGPRAARRFIHMEYFIWERDELTDDITRILLDRLAAGVEVRIMYDYIGCISFKKDELKRLAAAGAVVSADVTSAMKLNYRNHRKLAVIDGEIGYTGGMNMARSTSTAASASPPGATTHMSTIRPGGGRSCRSSSPCAGSRTSTRICCATSTCRQPMELATAACSRRPSPTRSRTSGRPVGART